ncbi:MAG: integrase family protein [Herbinix sp.]|jgi:hypothetical protein|nr:integrase family protein [Herbinix sp.]
MADFIQMNELNLLMEQLKEKISSELLSSKLTTNYLGIIDGFIQFCQKETDSSMIPDDCVARYFKIVTGAKPYCHPDSAYLRKLARPILMIRDILSASSPAKKYCYNTLEIPNVYRDDIHSYKNWLLEENCGHSTIRTRVGRMKPFLIDIYNAGCTDLEALTVDILIGFIGCLGGKYTSAGKTNILYTVRNYFSCPYIKQQLRFDPSPFLRNLHTNKHESLESCYTPSEIRQVMEAVDRSTAQGKMIYLMMLLACIYGLRSSDIRTLELSSIDWKK